MRFYNTKVWISSIEGDVFRVSVPSMMDNRVHSLPVSALSPKIAELLRENAPMMLRAQVNLNALPTQTIVAKEFELIET